MANVEIKVTADNQAGPVLDKLTGQIKTMSSGALVARDVLGGMGISLDGLANPAQLAGKALRAVYDTVKQSIDEFAAYGKQVGDVSRQLGVSAEEASKLIQVADDLEIEFGTLRIAMRTAQKDGISPTIDGLKQLAAEYQQISDPAARAAFAMDKFGRSGIEMQKFLELAPEQIDEMAASAEAAGLVMSNEGVQAAKEYRMALDNLNDSVDGLKMRLGKEALPIFKDAIDAMSEAVSVSSSYQNQVDKLDAALRAGLISQQDYNRAVYASVSETLIQQGAFDDVNDALTRYDESVMRSDSHLLAHTTTTRDAAAAQEELNGRVEYANSLLTQYSKQLLFTTAAQGLDANAALALARAFGLVDERVLIMNQEIPALTSYFDKNKDGVIDASEAASGYTTVLQGLERQLRDMPTTGPVPAQLTPEPIANQYGIQERASGGPVMPSRPYIVGERGPELFVPGAAGQIVNNRQLAVSMNIYGGGGDPGAIAQAVARELARR